MASDRGDISAGARAHRGRYSCGGAEYGVSERHHATLATVGTWNLCPAPSPLSSGWLPACRRIALPSGAVRIRPYSLHVNGDLTRGPGVA